MTLRPVTWEVREPITGRVLAIVQAVHLGPRREPYFRSVTAEPDPSERRLIGYWGTPDDAHDGTLASYEHRFGRSLSGGGMPLRPLVPTKPPPVDDSAATRRPVPTGRRRAAEG